LRHLFHVEAGLGRPVYAKKLAWTHSRIVVIRERADQRDAVTGSHGIHQVHQRRKVGVAAAHENQVLRYLPLSWFEDPMRKEYPVPSQSLCRNCDRIYRDAMVARFRKG
jgi:hypothetical protein